jgi:bleomycin hydrolase
MYKSFALFIAFIWILGSSVAQTHPDFTIVNKVKTSSVKSQDYTGTCWSFATTSFIETEAIRKGKPEFDLSEMYFVYKAYMTKGEDYIRFHGRANFDEGGQAHDVLNVIRNFGLVPESVYSGINYDSKIHNHSEMVKNLKSILDNVAKSEDEIPQTWKTAFENVLKSYLGELPKAFVFNEKTYSPVSFNEEVVQFNPDDYIEFTSYSHHPYYKPFDLEVPDNWSHDRYFNLPIDELMEVMNHALANGFSVDWDGDMSEKGINHEKGINELLPDDYDKIKKIGIAQYRQETFDNYTSTDDHLMHIIGTAKNKDGKIFYITKNSWGVYNKFEGYIYISEDFVKIKTIAFLVHKDAIPDAIANKCGLK